MHVVGYISVTVSRHTSGMTTI